MSKSKARSGGSLTIGSLRGLPQMAGQGRKPAMRPTFPVAVATKSPLTVVQSGKELPPSKRGQRCCRTGCAGCPVGEAIRRARAQSSGG